MNKPKTLSVILLSALIVFAVSAAKIFQHNLTSPPTDLPISSQPVLSKESAQNATAINLAPKDDQNSATEETIEGRFKEIERR